MFQGVEFNGLVPGHVFGKFDYAETEPVVKSIPRLPYGHQQSSHGHHQSSHQDYSTWSQGPHSFPYKRDTNSQAKNPDYLPSETQSEKSYSSAKREYKDGNVSPPNKNFRQSDFQKIEETFANFFPTFDAF